MLKKFLKLIGFAGKTVTGSVGKSMDFIDDALEKEYITSTIEKAKEATGEVVQKVGEVYGKAEKKLEVLSDDPRLSGVKEKVKSISEDISEKADKIQESLKDKVEDLTETPLIKNTVESLNEKLDDLQDQANKAFDRAIGEEE